MISLIVAVSVAVVVSILLTPQLIKVFARRSLSPPILGDDSQGRPAGRGIPTMGGAVVIVAMWAGYLVSSGLHLASGGGGPTASGWLLLLLSTGLGAVGLADDFLKIRRERSLGLQRWVRLSGRVGIAAVFGVLALQFRNPHGLTPASVHLSYSRDLPLLTLGTGGFIVFAIAASAAWSTAVRVTDGLNGLVAGTGGLILGAYTFISFFQARKSCFGGHLTGPAVNGCYQIRDPLDIATVAAAGVGACFGMLWWNAHPGRISLGSSGSFTLGGLIAGLSILSRTELLTVVLGAVLVMEALSVAIQFAGYRTRKVRIFTTAPLHQHFQLTGWTETTAMIRFWLLAAISVALGAGLFYTDWLSRTGG